MFFFIFFRILNIFNTHTGRGKKIIKKLTVMYIQKCLTLEYTAQVLNIFNLHSFSNVGLQLKFLFVLITTKKGYMNLRCHRHIRDSKKLKHKTLGN